MDDREKRFVDELLDVSLRHYANAKARPGLEGRVLVAVRVRQQAERRRRTLVWIMGMAGAAAIVALLVIYSPRRQPATFSVTAKAPAIYSAPAFVKIAPVAHAPSARRMRRNPTASRVDTRPQQFPTPRPLSEQEKLLLIYAQSLNGSSEAPAPDADQGRERDLEIPPIRIAEIKIEPLPSSESGEEN